MEVPNIVIFKIIVLGFQGSGKSSLVTRYIKGEFLEHYNVTVGVEYSSKIVSLEPGRQIKLQIWDTAGQELFRSLVKSFYKGISAVLFVYSVDSRESFEHLKSWSNEVKEHAHEQAVLFLVAAKSDVCDKREVQLGEAQAFLRQIGGAYFMETSAKTGFNINNLFKRVAQILWNKYQSCESFRGLVSPSTICSSEGTRERGDSLVLRRATIQKEVVTKRKKKCCE